MVDILFVSPYKKMSKIAEELLNKTGLIYKIFDFPNMPTNEEAVKIIKDNEARVIITRGGLAQLFQHAYKIQVVEIPVGIYDILDSLSRLGRHNYKKIAVMTFSGILEYSKREIDLGDLNIKFISFKSINNESIKCVEKELVKENVDFIIGDSLSYEIALKNKYPAILIESSTTSIKNAINQGMNTIEKINKEINMKKRILKKGWSATYTFEDILGNSGKINTCKSKAMKFAKSDRNLMLIGDTGTGKELFAQSIHNESDRFNRPFVPLNCAALSESLIESELFGYEKGSFTGASDKGKEGLFISADGGTLFLDEISETSMGFQAKLLRVLQERKIRQVGASEYINIDVRIISSTNKDIQLLIEEKQFREDLYYRLNELEIKLPSLRERNNDIILLAKKIMKTEYKNQYKKELQICKNIFRPLLKYDWPGNIRELKNFIVKFINLCEVDHMTEEYISEFMKEYCRTESKYIGDMIDIPISKDLKKMESELFKRLLIHYENDKEKLCYEYNISNTTLWRKLNYSK